MLAAQTQEREIDGVTYHVRPLPAGVALRMAARVLKMASPAFHDVPQLLAAASAVTGALEALAAGLLQDLDESVVMWCAEQFARVSSFEIDDKRLPFYDVEDKVEINRFDQHFAGRFVQMLKWLSFAASVSFPFVSAMSAKAAPDQPAG